MKNPAVFELCYKKYMDNLNKWLPDGVIKVDLELLHQLDLLHNQEENKTRDQTSLTRYFHVIESQNKLTLANDDFVVWIVPETIDDIPLTFTLIALNKEQEPKLELAFTTEGIYNNSYLVLRLLERYLIDIQSTEETLNQLKFG